MKDLLRRLLPRSFAAQCAMALGLGILLGLGFGPRIAFLKPLGDILSRATLLLVLPYLLFELTGLFGSLESPALRALTRGGGLLFGFGLLLSAAQIVLLPLMLPDLPYSPAFDPRMLETPPSHSLLDAFLPENIIQALANGNFTALVLFSGCLGLTIQRMDRREEILAVVLPIRRLFTEFFCLALDILTPIGILGIVAVSVGTMDPVDTQKLVGLLAMFLVTLLVNGGVLYPGLYLASAPFGLSAVVRILREPVLISVTTGNIILALPLLCRNLERFIVDTREGDADVKPTVDSLTAVASLALLIFSLGEHLNLLYLPFAAWFKGTPLSIDQSLSLLVTALPASLGAPDGAISEGLGKLGLASEMLNLYFVVSDWIDRIGCVETLIAATTGILMLLAAERRCLRWRIPGVLGTVVLATGLGLGSALLAQSLLSRFLDGAGTRPETLLDRPSLFPNLRPVIIEVSPQTGLPDVPRQPADRCLRAGVVTNNPPWAFLNRQGEWVGHDIDLLKGLARTLDTRLELLPGSLTQLEGLLGSNRLDCVVGGILPGVASSIPFQNRIDCEDLPLAVLVRDRDIPNRVELLNQDSKRELRIAVVESVEDRATRLVVRNHLTRPETRRRVRFVPIGSVMDFIGAKDPPADV
ncbi:MAG: cation:dicarboxylate symporter family transporter, partial [Verrucomicrobiota bacterium]